jgi:hypothetical protein
MARTFARRALAELTSGELRVLDAVNKVEAYA